MKTRISVQTIYHCSLERAFKSPMLCDISKVHTGYGIMPKVSHCTDDEHWGKPGGTKKIFITKSMTQKGGFASVDKIIDRIENKFWKIEVSEFQSWMLGFNKFEGEWRTTELELNKIQVKYSYTLYSNSWMLYPLNWLFTKLFWQIYMKRVLEKIRLMILNQEPYLYD